MKSNNIVGIIILLIVYTMLAIGMYRTCENEHKSDNTTPVEEMKIIDSVSVVNDSVKIEVNNLDSIKNAKVIEVKALDNDSTVKLFYKLLKQ